jgi:hypothetical protein
MTIFETKDHLGSTLRKWHSPAQVSFAEIIETSSEWTKIAGIACWRERVRSRRKSQCRTEAGTPERYSLAYLQNEIFPKKDSKQ